MNSYNSESITQTQTNEISIYLGETASPLVLAQETAKLHVLYPKVDKLFFPILVERLIENKFTEKRLKDAVAYLIDNFKYQQPTIADIISYDKKITLYSYSEVVEMVTNNKCTFDDFYKHWVGETLYRVKKSDAENYNLVNYLNQSKLT